VTNLNSTVTGKACQSWDIEILPNSYFPHHYLSGFSNNCRDPLNLGYNWCYVDIANTIREPCQIEGKYLIFDTISNHIDGFQNVLFF
jgi:hypothetical protein